VYRLACGVLLAACVAGAGISLKANLESLAGSGWHRGSISFWTCQILLLTASLPIVAEVLWKKDYKQILDPPRALRKLLWALTAYYTGSFYFFLYRAPTDLSPAQTWQVFSSGMMLAFALAGAYYAGRFARTKSSFRQKNSTSTLPSP